MNNSDPTGRWVGFIGVSASLVFTYGITGMIGLIFDGKNFGVYFCFSYKSFGFSLSVNICGGFYKKYKTVYNFYNDKNIVSYSISFFDSKLTISKKY